MFVVMVALAPCKSYCCYFNLLIHSNDVYIMAAELTCKQITKLKGDLFDLWFLVAYLQSSVISCIGERVLYYCTLFLNGVCFRNIFLGETFSCYVSIHNDSKQTCRQIHVKVPDYMMSVCLPICLLVCLSVGLSVYLCIR